MPIDIGLTDDQRAQSVEALKKLLGETYALYAKTHGYHWNVTGPRFNALHTMFELQYNELWAALDEIAERCARLPVVDDRSADDILGYGENGLPQ